MDQDEICKQNNAFQEAWNRGDAKAAASFYTDDATRVGAFGDIQHGRKEIEEGYKKVFKDIVPGGKVQMEKGSVRMLNDDYAVWQGGIQIDSPGRPPLKGHVVQVMKKENGRWLVVEAHPKFFPPKP